LVRLLELEIVILLLLKLLVVVSLCANSSLSLERLIIIKESIIIVDIKIRDI
jgi:hypothetical protein